MHCENAKEFFHKVKRANKWDASYKITAYSARIRLATMMLERGLKESNVYDRRVMDYKAGIDILYEAEKIKYEIFNFEHDLWSY